MQPSRRRGLILLGGGCLFVVVFGSLFFLSPRSQDTLIPQIGVAFGIGEIVTGIVLLLRSRR
ncbi:hypothetical protein DEI99_008620 [Curtobacterium sp. MCLR17_036]|uniref:hypothetical protein n=1 Tax=Curtobacterium sp. MCLR17_036 TaxID=2175620 RepID=UPI000DAAAB6C|nr:hypothetical protein [Curtobacterium sp. MCLR17_036]WIE63338.1 hypothetical protein DEI99_008620 [Curtobacterium sp. MCLR17_036]